MRLSSIEDYRQALAQGRLAVAHCRQCGSSQTLPSESCFSCGSTDIEVHLHDGEGRIFSWVVNHHPFREELAGETPYMVVLVALEGGGRVYGRLEPPDATPAADAPVVLDRPATADRLYPVFRLADARNGPR